MKMTTSAYASAPRLPKMRRTRPCAEPDHSHGRCCRRQAQRPLRVAKNQFGETEQQEVQRRMVLGRQQPQDVGEAVAGDGDRNRLVVPDELMRNADEIDRGRDGHDGRPQEVSLSARELRHGRRNAFFFFHFPLRRSSCLLSRRFDGYRHVPLLVATLDVFVRLDDLVQRKASVADRGNSALFDQLPYPVEPRGAQLQARIVD